MKILFFSIVISASFFAACNNNTSKNQAKENATAATEAATPAATSNNPVSGLLANYIEIKNALVADNDKEAADAGSAMAKTFDNFDKASLSPEQSKVYNDIVEDAREHAEHIGANAGNIEHQREHFETLSQEMYDLVKSVGAGRQLYFANCPMYNNNKGANWLSETKEIKNPYFGQKMAKCGSVKEEIN